MRLGLIIPSSNTTMEVEGRRILSDDYSLHIARLKLSEVAPGPLEEMEAGLEDEADKLADSGVEIIGYGCTTGSLLRGLGHDLEIEGKIERKTGIPAVATSGAVVRALRFLELKKVVVATPYIDELNRLEKEFLEANGVQVLKMEGMGIRENLEIGRAGREKLFHLIENLPWKSSDGLFVSCTNLPTIDTIADLEEQLQKPVVSSNTATFWNMLSKSGSRSSISRYGMLLESAGSKASATYVS